MPRCFRFPAVDNFSNRQVVSACCSVPVPAPLEGSAVEEAPVEEEEAEAPPYYPPKPSAGTWFSWLPEDPMLLAGVIISFLSGMLLSDVILTAAAK